jgi:hypothetical protein
MSNVQHKTEITNLFITETRLEIIEHFITVKTAVKYKEVRPDLVELLKLPLDETPVRSAPLFSLEFNEKILPILFENYDRIISPFGYALWKDKFVSINEIIEKYNSAALDYQVYHQINYGRLYYDNLFGVYSLTDYEFSVLKDYVLFARDIRSYVISKSIVPNL